MLKARVLRPGVQYSWINKTSVNFLYRIYKSDKTLIINCAIKYNVKTIYLFGSSLNNDTQPRDIDLAVKGIEPALFFKFYGELMQHLSKPVDLVDLSPKTLFNALIEKRGARIYG